jgi:type II secretory pathway pseudopilin PulG
VNGLSTIELLVVIVILGSLPAMAALAYRGYMTSVKVTLSTNQMLTIEDRIKTDLDLTLNGVDTGLRLPGTNEPITAMSTCRDFLAAIKVGLAGCRNPFDQSPAFTYPSAAPTLQKEGKVRVTCYKLFHHGTINGADCPLREAAIRNTKFKVPCGSQCNNPACTYHGASCRGHDPNVWYAGMQQAIFVGKLLRAYLADGKTLDTNAALAACGLIFKAEDVAPEADY